MKLVAVVGHVPAVTDVLEQLWCRILASVQLRPDSNQGHPDFQGRGVTVGRDQQALQIALSAVSCAGARCSRLPAVPAGLRTWQVSHVLFDSPRIEDHGLGERLGQLAELDDDRQSLLHMLDALLTRKRLGILANDGH
jgi:hypothetical protein